MDNACESREDSSREDMAIQIREMIHILPEDEVARIFFYIRELYFA